MDDERRLWFHDLSGKPELICAAKAGRYVHVGDLLETVAALIDRMSDVGETEEERRAAKTAVVVLDGLYAEIAQAAATTAY